MPPYFTNCTWNIICLRKTEWFLILGVSKFQNTFILNLRVLLRFISSVQSLSHVRLFSTPWTAACQASLSITNSRSLLKLMPINLGMSSNHLLLCRPFLLLPSIFLSIGSFPVSQFFPSGGQSNGASASASVLPMTVQDWVPLMQELMLLNWGAGEDSWESLGQQGDQTSQS